MNNVNGLEGFQMVNGKYQRSERAVDISIQGDGKLWKELIKPGNGDSPKVGVEVFVNYVGRLEDGSEFDRSKGKPFKFNIGKGTVIKGWDLGIATMKKGEKARLICEPVYGYGEKAAGKIPPNSTLIFDVELLGWVLEDLTNGKDGGIIREKINEGGTQYLTPMDESIVEVSLEGAYNGTVFDKREMLRFTIGEGSECDICPGLEMAIKKFTINEKSKLTIAPNYAFGDRGKPEWGIPPKATITYVAELFTLKKAKEPWQIEGEEKLELCRIYKDKGTNYFKDNKIKLAIGQYKRIKDFLKTEAMLVDEKEEERKSLLLAGNLNLSLCYLKVQKNTLALNAADEALLLDNENEKGLFRRGMAYVALNEPEKAKIDFEKVIQIEPKNKAAYQQIQICNKMIREFKQKEKLIFGRMFDSFSSNPKNDSNDESWDSYLLQDQIPEQTLYHRCRFSINIIICFLIVILLFLIALYISFLY